MPSHPVSHLLECRPAPSDPDRVLAKLRLACGCTITEEIPHDRLLAVGEDRRIVVGKYPCPKGHPVVRPPS